MTLRWKTPSSINGVATRRRPVSRSALTLPLCPSTARATARTWTTTVAAAVVLGAEGVQMGTRMLSSVESGVHGNYKDAVLAAADDGTRLLSLPGNPTMRVLHRGMAVELAGATESPPLLGRITELYFEGDFGASVGNCGQVSARIAEILPVATIVEETWRGAQAALDAGLARLR